MQGATGIASQLQELKRPTQIAESFHLLNVIRKLVREFARQSLKVPMPSAIVKAANMRVVPETYRSAMETQVDVDKVEPHNLEWILETLQQDRHRHQVLAVPVRVPRRAGSDSYPDLNDYEYAAQW